MTRPVKLNLSGPWAKQPWAREAIKAERERRAAEMPIRRTVKVGRDVFHITDFTPVIEAVKLEHSPLLSILESSAFKSSLKDKVKREREVKKAMRCGQARDLKSENWFKVLRKDLKAEWEPVRFFRSDEFDTLEREPDYLRSSTDWYLPNSPNAPQNKVGGTDGD